MDHFLLPDHVLSLDHLTAFMDHLLPRTVADYSLRPLFFG